MKQLAKDIVTPPWIRCKSIADHSMTISQVVATTRFYPFVHLGGEGTVRVRCYAQEHIMMIEPRLLNVEISTHYFQKGQGASINRTKE